ncbi:phosphoribosylaminoimidazolesuccinocarboxamide synthase [Candidatus Magnetaquicoccus inordinatus]|uniref:phosphoribosylaminoimidazolesuccinocarboxamide synthase n=1 Tax=Candidatus Magnetaquicoccus inordinatus TaxID=2496818 RepID=UPI00187D2B1F|nr:phosphoribosylaminoimidazolesuccinocarboxamide synthase [Candidatus Magnetaquicoccus inordinatus]
MEPLTVDLSQLSTPHYKGSVQNLYHRDDQTMICETTASGSVFDVGSIFQIAGSDLSRAAFRHYIYTTLHTPEAWHSVAQQLEEDFGERRKFLAFINPPATEGHNLLQRFQQQGAPTHHLGMIDRQSGQVYAQGFPPQVSPFVLVEKFTVIRPLPVNYRFSHFWDYSPYKNQADHVVPLENIVRLGLTSGSSIYQKFLHLDETQRRKFLKEMGVEELPLWRFFPVPIADFTSKYEPEDRALSYQEALHISGLNGDHFLDLIRMTLLGTLLVRGVFREMGLTLWDIKWELAKKNNQLLFVDTIDTDSLRVTCTVQDEDQEMFVHFNKQAIRDYYKIMTSDWFEAVKIAKAEAAQHGVTFHEILEQGQKSGKFPATPEIDSRFLQIQEQKFAILLNYVLDRVQPGDSVAARLERAEEVRAIARQEVQFYQQAGAIHSFLALNSLRR